MYLSCHQYHGETVASTSVAPWRPTARPMLKEKCSSPCTVRNHHSNTPRLYLSLLATWARVREAANVYCLCSWCRAELAVSLMLPRFWCDFFRPGLVSSHVCFVQTWTLRSLYPKTRRSCCVEKTWLQPVTLCPPWKHPLSGTRLVPIMSVAKRVSDHSLMQHWRTGSLICSNWCSKDTFPGSVDRVGFNMDPVCVIAFSCGSTVHVYLSV